MVQKDSAVKRSDVFLCAALGLLVGCSTPEFRVERDMCTAEWITKIPPRLEREIYSATQSRQVPTGRTICQNSGTTTICDQVMRTEYYSVPAVRTVDRNKAQRDPKIKVCTQTACVAKYGNAACEA